MPHSLACQSWLLDGCPPALHPRGSWAATQAIAFRFTPPGLLPARTGFEQRQQCAQLWWREGPSQV